MRLGPSVQAAVPADFPEVADRTSEGKLVPGGGLEPPWPDGLRILSRLRVIVG